MDEHDHVFKLDESRNEYALAATEIHKSFHDLVERHLEEALVEVGATSKSFYRLCAEFVDDKDSANIVQILIQLLLGSTDFVIFDDIMRNDQKRSYYFQIIGMWQRTVRDDVGQRK
jgi:hypothetical protein